MRGTWIAMGLVLILGTACGGGASKPSDGSSPTDGGGDDAQQGVACRGDDDCTEGTATTCCDGRCTDAESDPGNCGACGFVCAAPMNGAASCEAGSCGLDSCNPGYKDCDQDVSNGCEAHTAADPMNCGACGQVCPGLTNGHATCTGGTCDAACDPGYAPCGAACLDTQSDPMNCGACGYACTATSHATATCTDGTCALACDSGYTPCGGACLDTAGDPMNCGACGKVCGTTTPNCVQGQCTASIPVIQVATAGTHTCALRGDGTLYCWGENYYGQLGLGSFDSNSHARPLQVSGVIGASQLVAGNNHTCALLDDGTAQCWGSNSSGRLGYSTTGKCNGAACSTSPQAVEGLSGITQLAAGVSHTCVLLEDGTARCWGDNTYGQLGDGNQNSADHATPVMVKGLTGITQIAAGGYDTCALLGSGRVFCWGASDSGQIGNGAASNMNCSRWEGLTLYHFSCIPSPTQIPAFSGAAQLAVGGAHACARMSDSSVSCWGANDYSQIGNGSTSTALSPTLVPGLSGVVEIGAGGAHTCARLSGGGISCWGKNDFGQLGLGILTESSKPSRVSGVSTSTRIGLGTAQTCAVLGDGSAACWGWNSYGLLGDGTTTRRVVPTPVVW